MPHLVLSSPPLTEIRRKENGETVVNGATVKSLKGCKGFSAWSVLVQTGVQLESGGRNNKTYQSQIQMSDEERDGEINAFKQTIMGWLGTNT